ncbi:hypothetical protein B0H13DRAFT_1955054 [Mycena leptocephala]|nr:hypothetical protein B0H13DRAFT_1955054 [Mycena leptocephala]
MGEPRHTGTAQKKAFAAMQDECVKKRVQVTAGALTNEALQLLFVSVQRNNLDLCAFYAIRNLLFNLPINSEDCQDNSQKVVTTTCTSILKHHLIFERFHSVQVATAICMCEQQIFFDGSAKKRTFTSAFECAVAVFSKQASASGFLDEIKPWVDRCTGHLTIFTLVMIPTYIHKSMNRAQEVVDMIKKYRPLIFGEVKG